LVTYVTDGIESAMAQAKAAAGDRDVQVRGGYVAQRAIEAGVLDEVQIHHIPVLLGAGRRLFDLLPSLVTLNIVRIIDTPQAAHIRYRVRRSQRARRRLRRMLGLTGEARRQRVGRGRLRRGCRRPGRVR
jgi:dihydrofolate reductase